MNKEWFEMSEIQRRFFDKAVWIPLRASQEIIQEGKVGYTGFKSEFFGVGSIAVPLDKRDDAEKLEWNDVGISHNHCGYFTQEEYVPANVYKDFSGTFIAENLVLDQRDVNEWHLNQDFVITLGLKREKDVWVNPEEDYSEVAKLHRDKAGNPCLLEVRANHLKDYLCARKMALYITSYRDRVEIVETKPNFGWEGTGIQERGTTDRWECRITEIHEGGMFYGEGMQILHVSRTDVDPEEDVPIFGFPTDENVATKTLTTGFKGRKLFRVEGELWRNEWVEPGLNSPIVRGDYVEPTVHFITDTEGKQENRKTLINGSRWLWFRPNVIFDLLQRRGGFLKWYTGDTGHISCSPECGVHFGINSKGLINVFAKDIANLPDWQQKIWAGHNISPDGKVSTELLDSQMKAQPASTDAPEYYLPIALKDINKIFHQKFGFKLLKDHDQEEGLLKITNRFSAVDKNGLFSLAKNLTKLFAERVDKAAIQKVVTPPSQEKWGSLKSLEKLLSTLISPEKATQIMGFMFNIYELRLGDAHLAGGDIEECFINLGIDKNSPFIFQGQQIIVAYMTSLSEIYKTIDMSLYKSN